MRRIFYENSLEFEINLIGYKQQGESVVFYILADGEIVYTGLIDCYKVNSRNYVADFLNEKGINELDFICWTHPHDDHTKGLDDVLARFCTPRTKFWTTDIQPDDYELYSEESTQVYKTIKNIHLSKNKEKMTIKYAKDHTVLEKLICTGTSQYLFQIDSFAPNSSTLAERKFLNKEEQGNLYSIGLIINVGRYFILLGGDVENPTIGLLEDYELENPIDYIKIPHHGSLTGAFIVDRMQSLNVLAPCVATTTVYRSGSIPRIETIKKYQHWGTKEIYCTGAFNEVDTEKDEYGIVRTNFDILEKREYEIETVLEKNATLLEENA